MIVYSLEDQDGIRYIGYTSKMLPERLARHLSDRASNHRTRWIKKLVSSGCLPIIRPIQHCETVEEAKAAEIWWIANLRDRGFKLVNGTNGGEGKSGYICSDETRRKFSQRVVSEQTKAKMRQSHLGKIFSQESREKMRNAKLGKPGLKPNEETKAKMSATQKARWLERKKSI